MGAFEIVLNLLAIGLLVLSGEVYAQNCPNACVKISECPRGTELLNQSQTNPQVVNQLRAAFCRYVNGEVTICCQKLGPPQTQTVPVSTTYNAKQHRNYNLLPINCGVSDQDRIVGGNVSGLYEFPWMTLLSFQTRDGLKFQCGGSLINSRYVLTAAHCLKGQQLAGVRVGEHDISTDTDCQGKEPPLECESRIQDIRVEEQIPHPQYTGKPKVRNDIALLRLKKPVDLECCRNAAPVCLPVTPELQSRNLVPLNATVAGWGVKDLQGHTSQVLLKAVVPVHTDQGCSDFYNRGQPANSREETVNKICAGAVGTDSCGGDSGGPLVVIGPHENKERYIQHGIVSYGPRLCGSTFPGVYTDVSKYMQWILDNIRP